MTQFLDIVRICTGRRGSGIYALEKRSCFLSRDRSCHSQVHTERHPYQRMKARTKSGPCRPLAQDEGTASRTRSRFRKQLLKTGYDINYKVKKRHFINVGEITLFIRGQYVWSDCFRGIPMELLSRILPEPGFSERTSKVACPVTIRRTLSTDSKRPRWTGFKIRSAYIAAPDSRMVDLRFFRLTSRHSRSS